MRIPKSIVIQLIKGVETRLGDTILRHGSIKSLLRYMVPRERFRRGYVNLRPLTTIGFMGMGKTVFASHLGRLVEDKLKKQGVEPLLVIGKSIVDIVEYLRDNKDLIKDREALYIFVDDMLYQGMSREAGKAKQLSEKYYSDIRHKFEDLGYRNGLLHIVFAGQRLKLIPPFFRNSPFLVFKPLVANDKYERETIIDALTLDESRYSRVYAEITLGILETAAKIIYMEWSEEVKSLTIIKPAWDHPYIYIQSEAPDPDKVFHVKIPFNYSGIYPEEDEIDINKMSKAAKKAVLHKIIEALIQYDNTITIREVMKTLRQIKIRADNNLIHQLWKETREKTT